jgi:DtxR family Mn-dependent transcriptional regulator
MGFEPENVHDIAEEIEHIQSPAFFRKVQNMLDKRDTDPHGSPIPDVDF